MKRFQTARTAVCAAAAVALMWALAPRAAVRAETRAVAFPAAFRPHVLNNVAASRTAPVAFVGSRESDTLFAFDPRTGAEVGRLDVGDGPLYVDLFEGDGRRLLAVSCDGFFGVPDNFVAVVDATDPRAMRVVARADVPAGHIFLFDSGTARIVAGGSAVVFAATNAETGLGLFAAFDAATGAELGRAEIHYVPSSLDVVEADGRRVVAVSHAVAPRGRVTVLDATDLAAPRVAAVARLPRKSGLFNVNNVALDAGGRVGYVASGGGNALYAFDAATGAVLSRTVTGSFPTAVRALRPGGAARIAVVNEVSASVAVYDAEDPARPSLAGVYESSAVFLDVAPAVSADGATIYAASTDGNRVYAVDAATGALRYHAGVGDLPASAAVWEGGGERYVCVAAARSADVTTFSDAARGAGARRFASAPDAVHFTIYQNVAVARGAGVAFVASRATDELLAVDLDRGALAGRVRVGSKPSQVAVAEDASGRRRVVVVGSGDASIAVVDATDPAGMRETARLDVGSPYASLLEFATVAVSGDGAHAFVADGNQFVHAVDLERGEIVSTVGTGFNPVTLALHESRGRRLLGVLNASGEAPSAAIVDATDPAAMRRVATAELPDGLVVALNNVPRFTTDGRYLVAGASISGLVFTIDAATGAVAGRAESSATVPAPFARDGAQMFAAVQLGADPGQIFRLKRKGAPRASGELAALDPGFFLVGNDPVVALDGAWGYVPNFGRASLVAFDPRTGAVTGELPLGRGPGATAIDPESGRVVAIEVNGTASRLLVASLADIGPLGAAKPARPRAAASPARSGAASLRAAGLRELGREGSGRVVAAYVAETKDVVRWDPASRRR